jgi:hypothetical protein
MELSAAMILYAAVLYVAISARMQVPDGTWRTLLIVSPILPIALIIWTIARGFRRMDEFIRFRWLEGIAVAAATTAGWTLTYGFLETAGFPRLSMFTVWPVMGTVWAMYGCLRYLVQR